MVAIDNKSNSTSNLVGIKKNVTVDEVDMLFAELFALVHSSSEETNKDSENNLVNINETVNNLENFLITKQNNIDKKTEDLSQIFSQIFYKDLV